MTIFYLSLLLIHSNLLDTGSNFELKHEQVNSTKCANFLQGQCKWHSRFQKEMWQAPTKHACHLASAIDSHNSKIEIFSVKIKHIIAVLNRQEIDSSNLATPWKVMKTTRWLWPTRKIPTLLRPVSRRNPDKEGGSGKPQLFGSL